MKRKRYFWQPELSALIIYWSITLLVLFYSLILSLENTHPYWKSNLVLGIFILLFFWGFHRFFTLTNKGIKSHGMVPWTQRFHAFERIEKIRVGAKAIEICEKSAVDKRFTYIMRPKQKQAFVDAVKDQVKIEYDDTVKLSQE